MQTLKFEEEYRSALEEFARASELNPSWTNPRKQQEQLVQYLDNTVDLIQANGRLKAKRLQAMLQVVYFLSSSELLLTKLKVKYSLFKASSLYHNGITRTMIEPK